MLLALDTHGPLALIGWWLLLRRGCWTHSRFPKGLMKRRDSSWSGVVGRQTTRMLLLLELLEIWWLLLKLRYHLLLRRIHHPPSAC